MIELMRNPRKSKRAIVSSDVIAEILRHRPKPRMGRMAFYGKVAKDLNVSTSAITTAMQRAK